MELLIYLIFAFFIGYVIGKEKGFTEGLAELDRFIKNHSVYNPLTNRYELK